MAKSEVLSRIARSCPARTPGLAWIREAIAAFVPDFQRLHGVVDKSNVTILKWVSSEC